MRLAKEYFPGAMAAGDLMKEDLHQAIKFFKPNTVIETGTYTGEGSSKAIMTALYKIGAKDFQFHTIEVNESFYKKAKENLKYLMPFEQISKNVIMWNGLSIPANLIPKEIDNDFPEDVYTDHIDSEEYKSEIRSYPAADMLGTAIRSIGGRPAFVLLDSAGHTGLIEFDYLMRLIPEDHSFILMLDDTLHRKHFKTMIKIRADHRFRILKESNEKFGHSIIKFN